MSYPTSLIKTHLKSTSTNKRARGGDIEYHSLEQYVQPEKYYCKLHIITNEGNTRGRKGQKTIININVHKKFKKRKRINRATENDELILIK